MKALIDADILRYEIGFGAVTMWAGTDPEAAERGIPPPWYMVQNLLETRIEEIMEATEADSYQLYLTEGETFRYKIATTKPYKDNRKAAKPWHFANLTAHLVNVLDAEVVTNIEADDRLAIEHLSSENYSTILCSRDKDLRQIPGHFFSWELGKQPSFGPYFIDPELPGWLEYEKGKLSGVGYAFFCAQMLMGDPTDTIPGLHGVGPKAAYDALKDIGTNDELYETIEELYRDRYDGPDWEKYMTEQGRLLWITRRLHKDGSPELWELGQVD